MISFSIVDISEALQIQRATFPTRGLKTARIHPTGRCALIGPPTQTSRFPRQVSAKGHSHPNPDADFALSTLFSTNMIVAAI
jgi:hypothetical protein